MSRKLQNVAPYIKKSATADLTVELEVLQAELTVAVFCQMAQVTTLLHEIHYYQKHDSFSWLGDGVVVSVVRRKERSYPTLGPVSA